MWMNPPPAPASGGQISASSSSCSLCEVHSASLTMSGKLRTFGKSPAAIILAEKIGDDKELLAKTNKLIASFSYSLKELAKLDSPIAYKAANLFYRDIKSRADKLPAAIYTYAINVLSGKYKQWCKDNILTRPS